jgi:tRNA (cmo5U34)-methyltransferase
MTGKAVEYRWNTSAAAVAFDQAAEFIHPYYLTIQDQIIDRLPFAPNTEFLLVDLGGGSGRLVERVLERFPNARAMIVDQSEPFLALAERRLQRFGSRGTVVKRRLQESWHADLQSAPQALLSMSAIHHLDRAEKRDLYSRCCEVLAHGGIFMNGDEYRPVSEAEYRAALEWWAADKQAAEVRGLIPEAFQSVFNAWYDRNIRRFGERKQSGDDCHETIAVQVQYLRDAGFEQVETVWREKLWAIVRAVTPG